MSKQPNILDYIRELEDRIATLERGIPNPNNDVIFRAHLGTAQENITDNSVVPVQLNIEDYDPRDSFASYIYTVPVTGYYLITNQIRYTSVIADKLYYSQVREVDSDQVYLTAIVVSATTNDLTVGDSSVLYLTAGLRFRLCSVVMTGANTVDISAGSNGNATFMSFTLLKT